MDVDVQKSHQSKRGDESDDADGHNDGDTFYDDEDAFADLEVAPESLAPQPGALQGEQLLCAEYLADAAEEQQLVGSSAAGVPGSPRAPLVSSSTATLEAMAGRIQRQQLGGGGSPTASVGEESLGYSSQFASPTTGSLFGKSAIGSPAPLRDSVMTASVVVYSGISATLPKTGVPPPSGHVTTQWPADASLLGPVPLSRPTTPSVRVSAAAAQPADDGGVKIMTTFSSKKF